MKKVVKEPSENDLKKPILIMIPVFNDWKSLQILLIHLDKILNNTDTSSEVLVIDDASNISSQNNFILSNLETIKKVKILELKRNLGHQRAIAVGLSYIEANILCQAIVVMDGDGEDNPKDVLRLIEKCAKEGYEKVVFARRTKRSESQIFKLFYITYKCFYHILTGNKIHIGNFSIIPYKILRRLVVVSEIWNHYAAGLLKAKVPYTEIHSVRSTRLAGESQMNFVSLVTHGLSAISVYGDIAGVRLFIATCLLILLTMISIVGVIIIKFSTNLAIPGWTSYIIALLSIILMQAVIMSLFFIFVVLSGRNNSIFLPQRDYHYFILGLKEVFPKS